MSTREATFDEITADWVEFTGGPPVIAILGTFAPGDVRSLLLEDDRGRGLATWVLEGQLAELVSLHVEPTGAGLGRDLMALAESAAREAGARTIVLATSNDNLAAARFYWREGYRLVFVDPDAMDRVRALKPGVPVIGNGGVPLRDMWHFEKRL